MSGITDPSCIEYRFIRILNIPARYVMIHLYLLFQWCVHIFSLTWIPLEKRPKKRPNLTFATGARFEFWYRVF